MGIDQNRTQISSAQLFVRYWLPVMGYAFLIIYLSSLPIRLKHPPFPYYDKVFHFFEYAIYAWLWYRALRATTQLPLYGWGWSGIITFLVCATFGVADELYQAYTPYRVSDVFDIAADASGSFAAAFLALLKDFLARS